MATSTPVLSEQLMKTQNTGGTVSVAEFYQQLMKHDWFFGWSDDSSVTRAGEASYQRLLETAREGGQVHQWLLSEFQKSHFSGEPWNTPKHPLPPAPNILTLDAVTGLLDELTKAERPQSGINRLRAVIMGIFSPETATSTTKDITLDNIANRVRYMGAYAGTDTPPAAIAGHPTLLAVWLQGQKQVAGEQSL